jgi:hypothetical protein
VAGLILLTAALGACGGGDGDAQPTAGPAATATPGATATPVATGSTTPTTSPTPTDPSDPPPTATADATPSSTTPPGDPVEEISEAYLAFFDGPGTTVDEKVALLEDGETYRSMLQSASENPSFQSLSAQVLEVSLAGSADECAEMGVGSPCAMVRYNLLVSGFPMAAGIESPAVLVEGEWLVASAAWCQVVEIGGATCPA